MTLHIQLISQVRARPLASPHSPAFSPKRNLERSTTAGLRGSLKFHPLHLQHACSSQFRLLPHPLFPGVEVKYARGLFRCPPPTDVDRWKALQPKRTNTFVSVCTPGDGSKWRGQWTGRGCRRCSNNHGEYRGQSLMRKGKSM